MKRTVFALAACAALALAAPAFASSPPDPGGHMLAIGHQSIENGINIPVIAVQNDHFAVIDQIRIGHAPPLIGDSPGHVLAINVRNGFDDVVIYSIRAGRDIASIDWGVAPQSTETIIDGTLLVNPDQQKDAATSALT